MWPIRWEGGPDINRLTGEFGGAFGDLGTFLPYVLGVLTVGQLAPQGVLAGFGITLLATGLYYRLPLAVQPMKVVGAVIIARGLSPGEVAA
ncbi:MAG: putative sulfate/molybdate transporter, partial [Candidatus Competibacteraceae bacterium]|nr:putative sulfate/molybdate transporter [Candidatus Competibacteraceae bacterium]